MKLKLISIILIIIAGVVVTMSFISSGVQKNNTYNQYITNARVQAEKEIPYMAVQNYKAAFQLRQDEENIYQEYLEQTKLLEDGSYKAALLAYPDLFPQSPEAYERVCDYYYETQDYKKVIETALKSRENGAATDRIGEYYMECAFMYRYIKAGLEEASSFLGGYARVKVDGLYGFIDTNGSYLLAPLYEEAGFFLSNSTSVYKDAEWYMVNMQGYKIAKPDRKVEWLSFLSNNWILVKNDGKYGYVNSGMIIPDDLPYEDATIFKNGVAAVSQGGKWALIDSSLQPITEFVYDDIVRDEYNTCINSGVVFAQKDGSYYMLDANGKLISESGFEDVKPFAENGPAAVCVEGKWGFADTQGNMVIEPQYEDADSFQTGLAEVCVDEKWGYINTANTIVVEPQFDAAKPFSSSGIAAVQEDDTWSYIKLLAYE
ncbi:MAG: WG repeat-containing protein [Lachnospiraceae bacterium]|nr:WG repeat-containing protein [Lachnospiraceae bacterium]